MQQNISLRQRLTKKTLGEVSTNTITTTTADVSTSDFRQVNPEYWSRTYRKAFPTFRFFLDNIDDKFKKSLERKIKLLGGFTDFFYSNKCTHIITSRAFVEELPTKDAGEPLQPMETNQRGNDQENVQPINNPDIIDASTSTVNKKRIIAKDPSQQDFFDKASAMNVEVWSLAKMLCVVSALMNKPAIHSPSINRGQRHENLDKMLMEEKRYGVNTGHRSGHAPRPVYVTFNDYYTKVEDVTGVHAPILVREFPSPTFDPQTPENARAYPWPKLYLKQENGRSPFTPPEQPNHSSSQPQQTRHISKKPVCATTTVSLHHQQQQQQQEEIPLQQNRHLTNTMLPPNAIAIKNTYIPPNTNFTVKNDHPQQQQQQQQDQSSMPQSPCQPQDNNSNSPKIDNQENNPSADTILHASPDISQLTSKTPYTTTIFPSTMNTSQSTNNTQRSKLTSMHRTHQDGTSDKNGFSKNGTPLNENMTRMDRRMISNQRNSRVNASANHILGATTAAANANTVATTSATSASPATTGVTTTGSQATPLRPAVAAKLAHDQAERKKRELTRRLAKENAKYCENCVVVYQDLEKHLQEESHLAFVRDQNNFKELDMVLATTRRLHR
ncbi:uncharacterized protein BX664DRAFT_326499 [Halteromyces radiatus]|uniref:uncharacterized protein n=1 Tax=Halteromyces radiatus TaxID=101107 RepID=UPI00221F4E9A|nr:uncharacterized protein BX664DRAFT_326499 [Halteromyces radiatus]KAI8097491.1 hypothetical protein BX664DRAFT_326499 [Halteromyces radiatus]